MAAAQASCPNCGAPIEFAIGSSMAKVCEFCRHTVVRGDRGLTELGKVADLAPTSSLVSVGDEGTVAGRPMRVLGRVQLDQGSGVWDEYFLALDHGSAWGWLAYAQGRWIATVPVSGITAPPFSSLVPERDLVLGQAGRFRVAEVRTARVVSAEGELPGPFPTGFVRHYADLVGTEPAFATLDYGENSGDVAAYLGWVFPESALAVVQLGPRSKQKVPTTTIRCPNCGGDVPALTGERGERVGCPYCGALSDIAERLVISKQDVARAAPAIPVGSRGTLSGIEYVCTAYLRRGSYYEGELYEWEEFLLWNREQGYRWLVNDPETGWSKVDPVNLSELDLDEMPAAVRWRGRRFRERNRNQAQVTYVLGEVYWKCSVGETTSVADFVNDADVLSREEPPGEVHWSYARPIQWPLIARAFGLAPERAGGAVHGKGSSGAVSQILVFVILIAVLLSFAMLCSSPSNQDQPAGAPILIPPGTFRGGGVYTGGK